MARFWAWVWFGLWSLGVASVALSARADAGTCAASFTPIYDVQGVNAESPRLGETISVEGVVTADFRGRVGSFGSVGGVFLQDPDGDGDERSSDALFLYFGTTFATDGAFAPGTSLRATGVVQEYEGETQLRVEFVEVCGVAAPIAPATLVLPAASAQLTSRGWVADYEALEGMLLTTEEPLRVADLGASTRYGELTLVRGAVPWAFTQDNLPDVEAFGRYEQAIAQRTLVLDDGSNSLYPPLDSDDAGLHIGAEWERPPAFVLRAPRTDAEGGQAAWRVLALAPPSWVALDGSAPVVPMPAADDVRVVAINLHNLFKDGGDNAACFPSFDASDCRGEATAAARLEHLQQSARHAATWGADVIAASEVQNDFGGDGKPVWALWVEELNAVAAEVGARCRAYAPVIPTDYHGGDAIAVALAYCAETLNFDGVSVPSREQVAAWGAGVFSGPNSSRLPIAGTWSRKGQSGALTVVVNHFKSRSPGTLPERCPNPRLPDCDGGDGQGYFNAARTKAAMAIVEWQNGETARPETARDQPVLVVGDLNSYPREAPLTALQEGGYRLLTVGDALLRPSYAYNGRLGALDHLLVSMAHLATVAGVGVFSANVGQAPGSRAFSDHDAVFVDLRWEGPQTCDCALTTAVVGTPGDDVLWGTRGDDVICGFGGDDVVFGFGGNDCIDGGLGADWVFTADSSSEVAQVEGEHVLGDLSPTCER